MSPFPHPCIYGRESWVARVGVDQINSMVENEGGVGGVVPENLGMLGRYLRGNQGVVVLLSNARKNLSIEWSRRVVG